MKLIHDDDINNFLLLFLFIWNEILLFWAHADVKFIRTLHPGNIFSLVQKQINIYVKQQNFKFHHFTYRQTAELIYSSCVLVENESNDLAVQLFLFLTMSTLFKTLMGHCCYALMLISDLMLATAF